MPATPPAQALAGLQTLTDKFGVVADKQAADDANSAALAAAQHAKEAGAAELAGSVTDATQFRDSYIAYIQTAFAYPPNPPAA